MSSDMRSVPDPKTLKRHRILVIILVIILHSMKTNVFSSNSPYYSYAAIQTLHNKTSTNRQYRYYGRVNTDY